MTETTINKNYRYIIRPGAHINDPVAEFKRYKLEDIPESAQYTGRIAVRIILPDDDPELKQKDYRIGELFPAELYYSVSLKRWIEF